MPPASTAPGRQGYDERLGVPWRWWALATMFAASVLVAFLVATPVWVALGVTGILVLGLVTVFMSYGSARVTVADGVLRAGRARIPLSALGDVQVLDVESARLLAGRNADARAYLLIRPYLRRAVRVEVVDPADPAPYWMVATRRPDRLAGALTDSDTLTGTTPTGVARTRPPMTPHRDVTRRRHDGFGLEGILGARPGGDPGRHDGRAEGDVGCLEAVDRQAAAEQPRAPGRLDG
ncbi:MAG TPA: DUF3093 domain-containing protein [Nocardioidaceae bacterium]|nr:DUF3093 domain-containing protein [Nocardioidaceae bacterium]